MKDYCNTFWGSHGCDLSPGHEGLHKCIIAFFDDDERIAEVELCCSNDGEFNIFPSGKRFESPVFSI